MRPAAALGSAAQTALPSAAASSSTATAEAFDAAADARAAPAQARFSVGSSQRVGPAGAATATASGVLFTTRQDELRFSVLPGRSAPGPDMRTVQRLDESRDEVADVGATPVVLGGSAYFASQHRLLRRKLQEGSPAEVLATGIRSRVPVSGAVISGKAVVAFIADPPGHAPIAESWIDGQGTRSLTPEGASASSVTLAPAADELWALALEGRGAMSPLHARRVRLVQAEPEIGEDAVVWVGGPAQPSTRVTAYVNRARELFALVPMERDATHFGLAVLRVSKEGAGEREPAWLDFPNGLDAAPVTTGSLCDAEVVLYVQPATPAPGAPAELHLAIPDGELLSDMATLARAERFRSVSLAKTAGGGIVAYVTSDETRAVLVSCGHGEPARRRSK